LNMLLDTPISLLMMNLGLLIMMVHSSPFLYISNHLTKWRMMILNDFGIAPIICTFCGNQMI